MKKNNNNSAISEIINGIFLIFLFFGVAGTVALFINLSGNSIEKYISSTALIYSIVVIVLSLILQLIFRIKVETIFVLQNFILPIIVMLVSLGLADEFLSLAIHNNNVDTNSHIYKLQEFFKFDVVSLFPYFLSTIYLLMIIFNILILKKN